MRPRLTYSHMIDFHAFREFEHSGWQGIPRQYHQAFGELTIQSIEPLLDAAGVKAGTRVIDIASGPGYVAAAAASAADHHAVARRRIQWIA